MLLEILVAIFFAATVFLYALYKKYQSLYETERFAKRSSDVKHGLTYENLMPFAKDFPGDPRAFRFIGDPVDGVLFGENEITFVEFKSGNARLNGKQSRIKRLVEEKRVVWKEIRSESKKTG